MYLIQFRNCVKKNEIVECVRFGMILTLKICFKEYKS